jgi:hypothetical protein
MGQILLAGEEPHERSTLECGMIADRSPQHWISGFQHIKDRALGDGTGDLQLHLAVHASQRPQMCREHNSNHVRV